VSQIIGKKWMLLILIELNKGDNERKRFSNLKARLKTITSKVLSERLKELLAEEMIEKRVDKSVVPMISEYRLTKTGLGFMKVMKEMKKWALECKVKNKYCSSIDCSKCIN
jgi:DNA-binding HxlR family transcriptional regulator